MLTFLNSCPHIEALSIRGQSLTVHSFETIADGLRYDFEISNYSFDREKVYFFSRCRLLSINETGASDNRVSADRLTNSTFFDTIELINVYKCQWVCRFLVANNERVFRSRMRLRSN